MHRFYLYVSEEQHLNSNERIIDGLSHQLREDVLLYLYKDLLSSKPFFATRSTHFILETVQARICPLVPQISSTGWVSVHTVRSRLCCKPEVAMARLQRSSVPG